MLIRKGFVANKQEAFDKYLAKALSAYVPRFVASPEESIRQIHNADGLAILAHPFYLKAEDDAELESIIGDLKSKGLDGMETQYSTHSPEQRALAERIARDLELAESGGSDYHGEDGRSGMRSDLGTGIQNTLQIPYEILENLKALKARRRAH